MLRWVPASRQRARFVLRKMTPVLIPEGILPLPLNPAGFRESPSVFKILMNTVVVPEAKLAGCTLCEIVELGS